MSGISHLYDIYNKKGKEFVDVLFNSYVTVNEKMDGSAFVFERDLLTGDFNFYKRDQRNPITLVDRTLMRYYENPIQYIESLSPHVINSIPRGWRFGLEYFANSKPVEIAYDRVPKNHLILSYVHTRSENGKPAETIQDKNKLDTWADLIGVERPPIIFQGYLNGEQKAKIIDFLRTPFDQLVSEYKTKSFVRHILGVLNPEIKSSALNSDLDKAIEGIVFRFGEDEKGSEPILSKMVDPVFTEMAKMKYTKKFEDKPSDFLGITIMDVMNFILENGVEHFKTIGNTNDERYISFISDVFSKFLDENGYKYKGADFQEPEYLKQDEFRLNKEMLRDPRVIKYIESDDSFESLFKLILNTFRKIRKRASNIITVGIIDQFNMLVTDIEKAVEKKEMPRIQESVSIPSFMEFKKNSVSNKVVDYIKEESDAVDDDDDEKDDHFYSYKEFISTMETVDTTKRSETKKLEEISEDSPDEEKKLNKVNLMIGRFQPFHNGHLKMAAELMKKNKLPSIVAVVHPGHNKSGKSPFDIETINKYMENVVRDNSKNIQGYFIINKGLLGPIYGRAKELGYIPQAIGAGDDRTDDYKKQCDYLKKAGGDFPKDMEIIETPRSTSGTDVRKKLDAEDYLGFNKLVPPAVSLIYDRLVSSIKGGNKNLKESIDTKVSVDLEEIEERRKNNELNS
jgi:hypothetical protein